MHATSRCMWYIRLPAWRRISPAVPQGRAVLCAQTEGEICRPLVAVCGIYDCAMGSAVQLCAKGPATHFMHIIVTLLHLRSLHHERRTVKEVGLLQ